GIQTWRNRPQALATELRDRGVSLGSFEASESGSLAGYGVLFRNAVRTDLEFDLPIVEARSELRLPDGRVIGIGYAGARPGKRGPLRVEGRYKVSGEGADRRVQLTLLLVDPGTGEQRAAIVESGMLRRAGDVVLHVGDRLRSFAGIEVGRAAPLSPVGRIALD